MPENFMGIMHSTIGSLLLDRLYQLGLHHIFGVPGDYVLTLYQLIEESPIKNIGTTREDCAGFAADAYARIHGIGGVHNSHKRWSRLKGEGQ